MTGINPITTALMPISQVVSWYLILRNDEVGTFYRSICSIATFYSVWAIYNIITQRIGDLGVLTMAFLAVASYLEKRNWSIVGTALVWINYALPSIFVLILWNAKKTAKLMKNDTSQTGIGWAYIFKAYCASNLALWGLVLYRLTKETEISAASTSNKYEQVKDDAQL
jgi:hypothetical protein